MSIYEQLSDELLAGFYVEIKRNIKRGILSEAMFHEIALMKAAAEKRKMSEQALQEIYRDQVESQYNQTNVQEIQQSKYVN
ncbi:hypothetical protein LCM00_21200 [Bacillus infantis]|uniref:hypothetical protein n=1 Tax=Bacillus infantis TaxID=324767 RepID=UPI001CD1DC9E|nr:hypothetical protein [Bacillus infantis]MCA1037461.1 hypothetical protein [Bacillus infantis]MCA1042019.1 hypothetical protein [Bacillus infantis]HER2025511.1 hypothetical protein [Streptococcus pyogenes]